MAHGSGAVRTPLSLPISKIDVLNSVLPASEGNLLTSPIQATNSPSYMRIHVCISVAGILRVARINPAVISGDVNCDGKVNAVDITKLERIILGLDTATLTADVNQDGVINNADITALQKIITMTGPTYPVPILENLNSEVPLVANAGYSFEVPWRTGDSVNLRYSATGGIIVLLRIEEVSY